MDLARKKCKDAEISHMLYLKFYTLLTHISLYRVHFFKTIHTVLLTEMQLSTTVNLTFKMHESYQNASHTSQDQLFHQNTDISHPTATLCHSEHNDL